MQYKPIDYAETDEHRMIQETIRRFVLDKLAPIAAEIDKEERFPLEGIKEAAGSGVEVRYALGAAMPGEDAKIDEAGAREAAVALAKRSDAAVVLVGYSFKLESEGFDRPSLDLPPGQDDLIRACKGSMHATIEPDE